MAMRKTLKFCILVILFSALGGCASVINPYSEEFTCPIMESGKCVPIPVAYQESLQQQNLPKDHKITLEEKQTVSHGAFTEYSPIEEAYRDALFEKLTKLLKDPKTPIIAPPKVVRVLILPYQKEGGKDLYSARYIYMIIDDPRWILDNITFPPEDKN